MYLSNLNLILKNKYNKLLNNQWMRLLDKFVLLIYLFKILFKIILKLISLWI